MAFAYVSFKRTPASKIAEKAALFEEHGWSWIDELGSEIARARKASSHPLSPTAVEDEIRELMGECYIGLSELAAPGSTFGQEPAPYDPDRDPSRRQATYLREAVDRGWVPTLHGNAVLQGQPVPDNSHSDPAVDAEGGAQLAVRPADPGDTRDSRCKP